MTDDIESNNANPVMETAEPGPQPPDILSNDITAVDTSAPSEGVAENSIPQATTSAPLPAETMPPTTTATATTTTLASPPVPPREAAPVVVVEKDTEAPPPFKEKEGASVVTTTTTTTSTTAKAPRSVGDMKSVASSNSAPVPPEKASSQAPTPPPQARVSSQRVLFVSILAAVACVVGAAALVLGAVALARSSDDGDGGSGAAAGTALDLDGDVDTAVQTSLLDTIRERGYLNCGVVEPQAGFLKEKEDEPNVYEGFDVDFCRALASAIFGLERVEQDDVIFSFAEQHGPDSEASYHLHFFSWADRWKKLNSTEVDLVFRSTYTMDRDVYIADLGRGVEFSSPYFYDGMVFGGLEDFVSCAEAKSVEGGVCSDLRICVAQGTTFEDRLLDIFDPGFVVPVAGTDYNKFPSECNVIAADRNAVRQVFARQQQNGQDEALGGLDAFGVIRVGTTTFSKEPHSFVTREGDRRWSDFVEYVLQALIYAESQAITQRTALTLMPTTHVFGPEFTDMFRHAVAIHGNYGEYYQRHLQSDVAPREGMNRINSIDTPYPAIWAFPFGDLSNADTTAPALEKVSPTVQAIRKRGFLRCGRFDFAELSRFDPVNQEYYGFDIDFCSALSAALFDGVDRSLLVGTDYSLRWKTLSQNKVDVLTLASTVTLSRDVNESSTGLGFSFTDPIFFSWNSFGGLPQFVACTDEKNVVVSPECQSLRACTYTGSTFYDHVVRLMGSDFFVVGVDNYAEMVAGLNDGLCNVIYDYSPNVREEAVRAAGYDGDEYVVGTRTNALDMSGYVTREDDPAWSDFVRWIVRAVIYAEEEGITQATADLMPRPTLWGPSFTNSFYHAVNAVGNYGEIYSRHVNATNPRQSQNLLNDNSEARILAFPDLTS